MDRVYITLASLLATQSALHDMLHSRNHSYSSAIQRADPLIRSNTALSIKSTRQHFHAHTLAQPSGAMWSSVSYPNDILTCHPSN